MGKSGLSELENMSKSFMSNLKVTNKSKHTIDSYKNTINSFILFIKESFDDFEIKKVKKSTLIEFLEYKNENLKKQGEISPNTKKLLLMHLKSFFKHIEDENYEMMYDFRRLFDINIKVPKRVPKGLTEEEREKLLHYLYELNMNSDKVVDYRNSLITKMFLYCGLRKNEMISLKISDFIEEDDIYNIYVIGKGDKEREVFIKKTHISLELEELKSKNFKYVCETSSKKIMDGSQVYRMLQSIYSKLNIKASVHDLRHTFAKTLAYKDVDITIIKELLGHSSIQTTSIYANPTRKRIRSVLQATF